MIQQVNDEIPRLSKGRMKHGHICVLLALATGSACSLPAVAQTVQRLWPGPQRVLLIIKVVEPQFYYCTWTMNLDPTNCATLDENSAVAFDLVPQRPLTFQDWMEAQSCGGHP